VYEHSASTVTSRLPTDTTCTPLGKFGTVGGLSWSDSMPGGPLAMQCTLQPAGGLTQPQELDPGRIIEVWRGGIAQFEGILSMPTPNDSGGWDLTAQGAGTYGDNYRDQAVTWADVNSHIAYAQALTPGPLRWTKGTLSNTGLYFVDQQENASQSVTEFLNLVTKPGYYTWHVGRRNLLTIFPVPSAPTRMLFSSSPQARALAGYVNALYAKYQVSADNADTGAAAVNALALAKNDASIAKHGRIEQEWDITGAGTMSAGTAAAWAAAAVSRYQAASWAGPIPITHGQYTTMTGVPVDIPCEHAGEVVQLVLADGPYGGEFTASPPVTFPVGKIEIDDATGSGAVSPFNVIANSLPDLLESMAVWLPKPAVTG
jgi:hypothetical protein